MKSYTGMIHTLWF